MEVIRQTISAVVKKKGMVSPAKHTTPSKKQKIKNGGYKKRKKKRVPIMVPLLLDLIRVSYCFA